MVGGIGGFSSGWAKLSPAGGSWVEFWSVPESRSLVQLPRQALLGYACGVTAGPLSCEHPFALCDRDEAVQQLKSKIL